MLTTSTYIRKSQMLATSTYIQMLYIQMSDLRHLHIYSQSQMLTTSTYMWRWRASPPHTYTHTLSRANTNLGDSNRNSNFSLVSWITISHMGWLHVVGSLEVYVSLAEYRLFYRTLLQKRPTILRSLLGVATP